MEITIPGTIALFVLFGIILIVWLFTKQSNNVHLQNVIMN